MNTIVLTFLLLFTSPAAIEGTFTIETGGTTRTLTDLTGIITAAKDGSPYNLTLVAEEAKDDNTVRVDFHLSDVKDFAPGEYKIEPTQSKTKFTIATFNDGPRLEPTVSIIGESGRFTITALRKDGMAGYISGSFEFTGKTVPQNVSHTVKGVFENVRIANL